MGMADPTMEFLRELDDPSKYVVRRGVPIGRPLHRKWPDGRELKITDEDLPNIAAETAAAEADSGVVMRMTLGHIQPGQSQESQPRLVGYARNPRVGTFGPKSAPCILADVYTMREFADSPDAGQYPFRSMEYRMDKGRITGLALLKIDPYSDLGVVLFHDESLAHVAFMENGMGDGQQQQPPPGNPPAGGQTMQMSAEDKQKADALFAYFMTANPWMAKCAADYGEQKPDDTDGDNKPVDQGKKPGKEDDVDNEKTAKMEADLAAVKAENARLAKESDEAKVDNLLAKFDAEGYVFDAAFEKDLLLKFDADGRTKYLSNARKQYSKKPTGGLIDTRVGRPVEGDGPSKTLDRDGMEEALAMMAADPTLTQAAAIRKVVG